jgi:hypothetical protein
VAVGDGSGVVVAVAVGAAGVDVDVADGLAGAAAVVGLTGRAVAEGAGVA